LSSHLVVGALRDDDRKVESSGDALIYREEVTAIIGALADLVVEVRTIRKWLLEDEEEDEEGKD
jgi:hypothetical protein